jgi:hypothetical protein
MLLLVCAPVDALHAARADRGLDPFGIWACLVYGDAIYGDERVVLRLMPDGGTRIARQSGGGGSQWAAASNWVSDRQRLTFADPRGVRDFTADLSRNTLGGTWRRSSTEGGWWCTQLMDAVAAEAQGSRRSAAEFFFPPLVPQVMASPSYPRQAIRDAKEGRAVVCFLVDSGGAVRDPEIVELSDQIFRDATMLAIFRSSYRPWGEQGVVRPGCRSYTYELDAIY